MNKSQPIAQVDLRSVIPIEKIFHFIWLGVQPLPKSYAKNIDSWRHHHPGWEIKLWGNDDVPPLRNQQQFDAAETWAGKSDVLRYEIVETHGGVYVDTDFQCLRPIDELLFGCECFLGREVSTGRIANALFGGVAGHPFFRLLIDLVPRYFHPKSPHRTGPTLFTRLGKNYGGVRIFEHSLFYPLDPDQAVLAKKGLLTEIDFSRAYAVHWYGGSWLGQALLSDRLWYFVSYQFERLRKRRGF